MIPTLPSQPGKGVGPAQDLKYWIVICWSLLLIGFVLPLTTTFIYSHHLPDADFMGFYSLGRILNEHPVQSLYDYELLKQVSRQVHPGNWTCGLLPYPPVVALFFRPFAMLPVWAAYLLWVFLSVALYAFALKLTIARFFPLDPLHRSLLYCLAFSYFPFITDTAANGQLSAIGFFALALTIREDSLDHGFRSGLAFSLCIYKPTLLVLLLPMLLLTRRWKALAGFASGASALAAITTAFEGFAIWPVFFHAIFSYGQVATGARASSIRPLSKYVDLTSFSLLLPGGRSGPMLILLFAVISAAILALLWFWRESSRNGCAYNQVLWAATITWTLLLNVYVPIYDTILVILAALLTASALASLRESAIYKWFQILCALIFVCSWFTVALAKVSSVQLLTLLLIAFGILQFVALKKLRAAPVPAESGRLGN
jgi:hypothetical protein